MKTAAVCILFGVAAILTLLAVQTILCLPVGLTVGGYFSTLWLMTLACMYQGDGR